MVALFHPQLSKGFFMSHAFMVITLYLLNDVQPVQTVDLQQIPRTYPVSTEASYLLYIPITIFDSQFFSP